MRHQNNPGRTCLRYGALLMASIAIVFAFCFTSAPHLAANAYAAETTASTLADGDYLMDVTLEGGSGRASVNSPTRVTVHDGKATARLEWSSPNYDYMLVEGTTYTPVNDEGNSVFEIPVLAFDEPFAVVGDTTAMSQPHEIEYTLTFDSSSAEPVAGKSDGPGAVLPIAALVTAAVGTVIALRIMHRPRKTDN